MKIVDLRWTHVAVPLQAPLRSADGVGPAALRRTILELETDDGLVGLGEIGARVSSDRLSAARYAEAAERQRGGGGRREPDPTRPGWFPTYPAY